MRLLRLHLKAFGPFTDRVLDFGPEGRGLVLVHGRNEAGKSSALRAMTDLRFGIPQQSPDNFLHPHPEMRIGGEFVDRHGVRHSLMRRKGRVNTLFRTDFDDPDAPPGEPVPSEVDAMLTCGLSRDEYELGFAIDHRRLREGGKALLEGKGEIGASLFEASAGVQSSARILERLEQSARRFFMPGARGRNARINEALRTLEERHTAFRQALVRPAHWAELSRTHRSAAEKLAALETRQRELLARLREIAELRAVAPLIAALDQSRETLVRLAEVPMLPESASSERAAAESGLAAARQDAEAAAAEVARQRERLAGLAPDRAMLEIAPAVRRLIASVEAIDRHRAEEAQAGIEARTQIRRAIELARRIDPRSFAAGGRSAGDTGQEEALAAVLERAPSPAQRAAIEEAVYALERATEALEQHRQAGEAEPGVIDTAEQAALPSPASRAALRSARAAVAGHAHLQHRLAELPAAIEAARRSLSIALADAGIAGEAELRRVRPLLDAQIDDEILAERRDATRREEHEMRLARIAEAREDEAKRRDAVLAQGPVPTREELAAARAHRDAGWALLLASLVGNGAAAGAAAATERYAGDLPLPRAYEKAVARADRVADALAAEHDRIARLQASQREIEKLDRDAAELHRRLDELAREETDRRGRWQRRLAEARLPMLPPAALRDWQARLGDLRAAAEVLRARCDENEAATKLNERLARSLCVAIEAAGQTAPPPGTPIDALVAIADEMEEGFRQTEKRIDTARGHNEQREYQRRRMAARQAELHAALEQARGALATPLAVLALPPEASPPVIRARLAEFDDLLQAHERALAAETLVARTREALARFDETAASIAAALHQPAPTDLRLWLERLANRLERAETDAREHALASQALDAAAADLERHRAAAGRHEATLANLCEAAGVASAAALPEAEAKARLLREARASFDRAHAQLSQASRQPVESLRVRLAELDAGQLNADESAASRELGELDEALRDAREAEEAARHALRAIDGADTAAQAREAMEHAAARIRADLPAWIRSRLAHALLGEAMKRFAERAQGPMLRHASTCFERLTEGSFMRLSIDDSAADRPTLLAQRRDGSRIGIEAMSEGTCDQLYLALRLAALTLRRDAGVDLPVVLDDVLMTSDDRRAARMLEVLGEFAAGGQAIVFTHHAHVARLARTTLPAKQLIVIDLDA